MLRERCMQLPDSPVEGQMGVAILLVTESLVCTSQNALLRERCLCQMSFTDARVLVQVLELSLPTADEELVLRIEFFQNLAESDLFSVRIWRLEHYRLQSTFPQHDGVPSDCP